MAIESINLGTAPNDGTGDDLRSGGNKVNKNFEEVLTFTGGAQYIDDFYTASNPLVITSGNTAKLTCNNATVIDGNVESNPLIIQEGSRVKLTCDNDTVIDGNVPPEFSDTMWNPNTNKLVAVNDKDRFITEIRFKAKNSVLSGFFDIEIDIGGTQNVISKQSEVFTKSANNEQSFKTVFVYFTGATFIENGGDIFITALNGDMSIYDIKILPTRIHKGY